MRDIKYYLLLLLVFVEISLTAQEKTDSGFYPLEVGDFIEYQDNSSNYPYRLTIYREVMGDTILTNGLNYKIVKLCCCANSMGLEPLFTFERKDKEGKVYIFNNNQDLLLYDFNLASGVVYSSSYENLWWQVIHIDSENVTTNLYNVHDNLIYQSIDFKKGIGPINYSNLELDSHYFENIQYYSSIIKGINAGQIFSIKDSFSSDKFYPLSEGDIFVYRDCQWFVGAPKPCGTIIKRVLNDTILTDGLSYKKIKYELVGLPNLFTENKYERKDEYGNIYESNGYEARIKLKSTFCLGDTFYSNIFYEDFNTPWLVARKYGDKNFENNLVIETNGGDGTTVYLTYNQGLSAFGSNLLARGSYLVGSVINGELWGDTSTVITGVDENNVINKYSLSQNFPNPFNPKTQISYSIQERDFITLSIYNTIGELVSTLIDEEKTAGNYSVTFDASELPSGIYFYRIKSGSFDQTGKMILIK